MGLENFIPQLVHAKMLKEREKSFIGIKNCNRDGEGEIKEKGDRVKFVGLGNVTINNYTKNNFDTDLELQTMDDQAAWLYITEQKYFNVGIDSIDAKQSSIELNPEMRRKAGLAQNDIADQFIYKKYSEVSAGMTITEAAAKAANIASTLGAGIQLLYENDVPQSEKIFIEVSPAIFMKMWYAKILTDTNNSATFTNGLQGKFLGAEVYMTNNIQKTVNVNHCLIRTRNAIGYAEQYVETKIYDLGSKGFGQAVKSLMLYGAEVLCPKELVRLDLTPAPETIV